MAKDSAKQSAPATAKDAVPSPVSRSLSPFEELDRMVERFMDREWMRPLRWEWPLRSRLAEIEPRMPKVDVIDRDKEVVVRAEVPGVDRKDLDVSVTDSTVTIKGQSSRETEEEGGDYYRCEIARGAFTRTVALPSEVDAENVQASFKEGILEITLPKIKEARRRKVDIK